MGLFKIFSKKKDHGEFIASKRPSGKFRVEITFKVGTREALVGEVVEGIIYPGYKLKGPSVGVVRSIEREHEKIDFAVSGDKVALIMESPTGARKGDVLEVYQS